MRMRFATGVLISLCFAAWHACASRGVAEEPPASYVYHTIGQRKLQVGVHYPPDWSAKDKRPAMLLFSGAHKVQPDADGKLPPLAAERARLGKPAANSGPPDRLVPVGEHFAKLGVVCLRVEYRTRGKDGVLPGEDVQDAVHAMRWLRTNANRLGVDPDKVIAVGSSSGAFLAAGLFALDHVHPDDDAAAPPARPNAIVLLSPLVDWLNVGSMSESFLVVLGGDRELGAKVSPARYWRKDMPPTLVLVGNKEPQYESVREFAEKWQAERSPLELYVAEDGDHGFFNRPAWFGKTMQRTEELLQSLGYLAAAPQPDQTQTQQWPRFRGPNGSGIGEGSALPVSWGESDYRWTLELPGIGHSSPVVWGQQLFVTSANESDGKRFIQCVNTQDGRLLWQREYTFAAYKKHQRNSFASSTPAVDAERVYVCWATPDDFTFLTLDHAGNEVWRRDLGDFAGGHGSGSSPIVFEDIVILPNDKEAGGFLIAMDCRTGETRWKVERRKTKPAYSTPCVYQPEGEPPVLVFTDWEHGMTAVNPRTGEQVWEADIFGKDEQRRAIGSPIVAGDLIIGNCGFAGGKKYVVAVRPEKQAGSQRVEVQEVYRIERNAPHVTTVLAQNGLLFLWADNGIVTCCDVATGKQRWQQRVGKNFSGSAVCLGGRLLAIAEDGEVVVLAAKDQYELLARVPLGQPSNSTPAIADGTLFLRTFSHVFALGALPQAKAGR